MERLWCVLAGYLFGSFLTADLIVFCRTGARRAEADSYTHLRAHETPENLG